MLLLDSTYIIGLLLKRDSNSFKSNQIKPLIKNEKKLINTVILTEVLNSLTRINTNFDINEILEIINNYELDYLTIEDCKNSLEKFKYYNYAINFSDCTILNTMEKYSVNKIVSFDNDFDKVNGIRRIYL